jgi:hypothetical protein
MGIGKERLLLDWVSAGEGQRFSVLITQFVKQIRDMGPFPLNDETEGKLRAIQSSLEGEKIRWMVGKAPELMEKENVYGEQVDQERIREVMENTLHGELTKNRIVVLLETGPQAAKELSDKLKLSLPDTLPYLVSLVGEGRIGFDPTEESHYPRYVRSA